MRKRLFPLFLVVMLACSNVGCASWIKQWQDNPVLALQTNISYVQTALQAAVMAFGIWSTANPDSVASFRDQFNEITGRVQQGITVALDGCHIAAVASGPAPDPDQLLTQARGALGDIAALFQHLPISEQRK